MNRYGISKSVIADLEIVTTAERPDLEEGRTRRLA